MGGCASKPKDLDTEEAPAPVEAPAVAAEEPATVVETPAVEKVEVEAETAPQVKNS